MLIAPHRPFRVVPAFLSLFLLTLPAAVRAVDLTVQGPSLPGLLPEPKPAPGAAILDPHDPFGVRDRYAPASNWPPADADPAIDVQHYALDLDFELNGFEIEGTARITVAWGSDPDNVLTFHLTDPAVTAVRDGSGTPLPYVENASTLDITLPAVPARDDVVVVEIDYRVVNSANFFVGANASYTFTEPEGSRAWFPCNDVPWDKATFEVAGTCASADVLVSNGVLDSTVTSGSETTYFWREDTALATYLMAVTAGNYVPTVPPASTVTPLTWYVYPWHQEAALNSFINVDAMMQFYDSLLVSWPFDKYAQVEANFGGGMEHQTCTLMGEFIVTGGQEWEWITAHELAHQYFGDWLTLESWGHIWLNEGFATFYDIVWHEDFYGPATFKERMDNDESAVLSFEAGGAANLHPIVDPPAPHLFSPLEYRKGSWVLRMLRDLIGIPVFNAAVVEYLATHGGGNADTDDFKAVIEAHHGEDLTWFFDQWLYGTGSPRLIHSPVFGEVGGKWLVQIQISQEHGTPTLFRLPLEVEITTTTGAVTASEWVTEWSQVLAFEVDDEPLSVTLDPDNKLLGRMFEAASQTAVDPALLAPPRLSAWPNPFSSRIEVAGSARTDAPATIDVFDLSGRRMRTLGRWSRTSAPLVWDGTDASGRRLPPGVFFLRSRETGEATRVVLLPD